MEAYSGSPPKYCFVLFYCLNLLLQLRPMNSAKFRLLKTKWKEKMTNLILRDLSAKKFETPRHKNHSKTRPIKNTSKVFEIGPKFSETHNFRGAIVLTPLIGKHLRVRKWPKLRGNKSPVQSWGWRESLSCDLVINIPAKLLYGELTLLS